MRDSPKPTFGQRALWRAVSFLALFALPFKALPSDIPCVWTGVDKVVAVGDLHGDYEDFVKILIGTGLVDENLGWTGGTIHLVQTGDIMDRGPDAKKIFDLLMRLEKEADRAGGKIHVLLGNHEEMNITGIAFSYPDYISVEQFLSFLPETYRREKEKEFLKTSPRQAGGGTSEDADPADDDEIRASWKKLMKTDDRAQTMYSRGFSKPYGQWLLGKNAVIRINDTIFVHGGISEKYSTWKLDAINNVMRKELCLFQRLRKESPPGITAIEPKIVYDPLGPLWFRGLATGNEKAIGGEFKRILGNLGAGHMVIAHTYFVVEGVSPMISPRFMSRFGERLWMIDTGISPYYGGANSALIIDKGNFVLWGDEDEEVKEAALPPQGAAEASSDEEDDRFLRSSKIGTIIRAAQKGRTDPWTILLDDGVIVRKAVFKHIDRRRPSLLPASFRYELAAHALDRLLDLGIVPAVIQREIDGVEGSLQLYVENAVPEALRRTQALRPPDAERFKEALESVKVFSLLVNDMCENLEDTLIDVGTWRVRRVDFSEAFAPALTLAPDCAVSARPEAFYEKLKSLDDLVLEQTLSPYLNQEEVRALIQRKALLLQLMDRTPAVEAVNR